MKSDFLNGTNGAPKMSKDQLDSIFELTNQTLTQKSGGGGKAGKESTNGGGAGVSEKDGKTEFNFEKAAENLTSILDGKSKKVKKNPSYFIRRKTQ